MSKKSLFLIPVFAGILLFSVYSCKKQETLTPPSASEFVTPTGSLTGAYYVQDDPNSVFKIPVGFTTVSDKDRTIQFTYTSSTGAAAGSQYNAPASITIPAGKVLDTLRLNGLFAGYPTGRVDTVTVQITGGDATANAYNNTYKVVLRKYCNVDLNALSGVYTTSTDKQGSNAWGPYISNISATSTGATTATLTIQNFSAAAFGPFAPTDAAANPGIKVDIDWTNPANFTTKMQTQAFYNDPTYGPATIKANGNGTFSSCDQSFTVNYTVTVAAGSFGNFTTVIKR